MSNREIKFRVWTGTQMEYNVVAGQLGVFYAKIDTNDSACLNPTSKYHPDTSVMQFTGLKDKNGKDIYEGDIMTGRDTPIVVCYNAPEFSFKYKNNAGGFCSYYLVGWVDFEGEIIGNIFENPDLLK